MTLDQYIALLQYLAPVPASTFRAAAAPGRFAFAPDDRKAAKKAFKAAAVAAERSAEPITLQQYKDALNALPERLRAQATPQACRVAAQDLAAAIAFRPDTRRSRQPRSKKAISPPKHFAKHLAGRPATEDELAAFIAAKTRSKKATARNLRRAAFVIADAYQIDPAKALAEIETYFTNQKTAQP